MSKADKTQQLMAEFQVVLSYLVNRSTCREAYGILTRTGTWPQSHRPKTYQPVVVSTMQDSIDG